MDSYFRARDILDKAIGTDSYFQIKSILFGLKAADVAPVRHGRWEMVPYNGVYDIRCSSCGYCPGIRFYSSNYCPNCGARMGKEDDHEVS